MTIVNVPACTEITYRQVAELAEMATRITIESEVILALLWGYCDGDGSDLQTVVDNFGSHTRR